MLENVELLMTMRKLSCLLVDSHGIHGPQSPCQGQKADLPSMDTVANIIPTALTRCEEACCACLGTLHRGQHHLHRFLTLCHPGQSCLPILHGPVIPTTE